MNADDALAVSVVPERTRCAHWPVYGLLITRKHTAAVVALSADTLTYADETLFTTTCVPRETLVELDDGVLTTAHST